jgi:FkbM family methyltransferase
MNEAALVLAKNVLFHGICLGNVDRYFALKGRLMHAASASGLYERAFMRLLPRFVRPGAVAVDVGASFGAYTRALARLVGRSGRVIAFEPVPPVRDVLARSCADLPQLTIVGEALSNTARAAVDLQVPLLTGRVPEPALATMDAHHRRPVWRTFQVPSSRLDDHADLIDGMSFVKADIEGHETAFLEGAVRTIERFRPAIQFEYGSAGPHRETILAWAESHRYDVLTLHEGGLRVASNLEQLPLNAYLVPSETSAALTSSGRRDAAGER